MPRRKSGRERLERLQAEKAAEEREKAEKKAAKKKAPAKRKTTRKKAAVSARMKLAWAVCQANGTVVETFPYPQKAEAQATAERMSAKGRADFIVKPEKVPMED